MLLLRKSELLVFLIGQIDKDPLFILPYSILKSDNENRRHSVHKMIGVELV